LKINKLLVRKFLFDRGVKQNTKKGLETQKKEPDTRKIEFHKKKKKTEFFGQFMMV
jgi:hypothetical protein